MKEAEAFTVSRCSVTRFLIAAFFLSGKSGTALHKQGMKGVCGVCLFGNTN